MADGVGIEMATQIEDGISPRLAKLAARIADLGPVMDEIGASNVTETQKRFEDEEDAEGERWQPLAALTLAGRKSANARILRKDVHLYDSITHIVDPNGKTVRVGSNRKYARIHQLGGMAGRGRKVEIPKRPYLGISEAGRKEAIAIVTEHLEAAR